ncbi:MAG: NAD-dependent epimerase/dehydratase family protein [Kiritimatiellae bacterium]|nr:NAD-dependent epimerase/dehydratase family protein [Kiritimatiellia bacterium]
MKVLVTGSAGFIGYHLCVALLSRGDDLFGIDNFNSYYDAGLKHKRHDLIRAAAEEGSFAFNELDVCNTAALQSAIDSFQPEVVVHLAAHPGARNSQKAPFDYMKNNCEGFLSVLECCRKQKKVPRLVFASSSSVYGRNVTMPFDESHAVGAPVSLYAATKSSNELIAHVYSDLYGMQCVGLRFFTVYGPWYRPDMALSLFADAMIAGRPLQIFNHGDLKRDFTFVDDVVDGITRCLFCENLDRYEIFNIGRSRPEKLMDIIDILAGELGVHPQFEYLPMQEGDMQCTWADISKITYKTGYQPITSISEGVPRFSDWYKKFCLSK